MSLVTGKKRLEPFDHLGYKKGNLLFFFFFFFFFLDLKTALERKLEGHLEI